MPVLAAMLIAWAGPCKSLDECTVWTLNEGCYSQETAELAASVPSDFLMRAWFKWHNAPDYEALKHLIPIAKAAGALFGGGTTVSALYRGENGLAPDVWRRLATRDPFGHILPAWDDPSVAHGAIASEEYLDYVLRWCYAQIDAGVDSLFMDEVQGAYTRYEGFDDASMAQFAAWLERKYCDGQGWRLDDPKWTQEFGIDLADKDVCPDGTIRTFNYRNYLIERDLAADPYAEDNPLAREWGGGEESFYQWRADWAWKYLCDHIREYAARRGRTVTICANGLNKWVDFQVQGFWIEWVGERRKVTTFASYLRRYRSIVLRGWDLAGRRVPVVFFHDWGFGGFPFGELRPAERIKWMRVYAPEIYAAGGYFCWPVNIAREEDLELIRRYTAWYQAHRQWFHGGEWLASRYLTASRQGVALAFWQFPQLKQRVVHAINHNYDGDIVPLEKLELRIPSGARPKAVVWASPELDADQPVAFEWKDKVVTVSLGPVTGYAAVALIYDELPADDTAVVGGGAVELLTRPMWSRSRVNRFIVAPDGNINDADQLSSFVQGNLHPHLRNNPVFVVDYPREGQFIVHVNSVAQMGATLDIYLDGKLVLQQDLPDLDKENDGFAAEYDQDYVITVPPGKHEIRVDNTGGDWLTVDYFLLINYRVE